jgi:hypothetical protein
LEVSEPSLTSFAVVFNRTEVPEQYSIGSGTRPSSFVHRQQWQVSVQQERSLVLLIKGK